MLANNGDLSIAIAFEINEFGTFRTGVGTKRSEGLNPGCC
jgi:hypothetical protein